MHCFGCRFFAALSEVFIPHSVFISCTSLTPCIQYNDSTTHREDCPWYHNSSLHFDWLSFIILHTFFKGKKLQDNFVLKQQSKGREFKIMDGRELPLILPSLHLSLDHWYSSKQKLCYRLWQMAHFTVEWDVEHNDKHLLYMFYFLIYYFSKSFWCVWKTA